MVDWRRFAEITKGAFDGRLDKHDFQILWMVSEMKESSLNTLASDPGAPRIDKTNIMRRLRRLEEDWFVVGSEQRRSRDYRDYDVKLYELTLKGNLAVPGAAAFRSQLAELLPKSNWYRRPTFWPLQRRDHQAPTNQSLASFVEYYSRFFLMVGHNLALKSMLANSRTTDDLAVLSTDVVIGDLDNMESLAEKHGFVIPSNFRTVREQRLRVTALLGDRWASKYSAEDPRHKLRENAS